jgi:hypothetical protein
MLRGFFYTFFTLSVLHLPLNIRKYAFLANKNFKALVFKANVMLVLDISTLTDYALLSRGI